MGLAERQGAAPPVVARFRLAQTITVLLHADPHHRVVGLSVPRQIAAVSEWRGGQQCARAMPSRRDTCASRFTSRRTPARAAAPRPTLGLLARGMRRRRARKPAQRRGPFRGRCSNHDLHGGDTPGHPPALPPCQCLRLTVPMLAAGPAPISPRRPHRSLRRCGVSGRAHTGAAEPRPGLRSENAKTAPQIGCMRARTGTHVRARARVGACGLQVQVAVPAIPGPYERASARVRASATVQRSSSCAVRAWKVRFRERLKVGRARGVLVLR
jgi:hypothetical protein